MNKETPVYDVAICGAGPVGMALAALLARRGMAPGRIALLDAKPVEQAVRDPRSIAISHGSRMLLEQAGAWPVPATAIHEIHVSRRGHFGRSLMDRKEHQVDALGYVAQYGDLVRALAAACGRTGIAELRPARVTSAREHDNHVALALEDGREITARISVQAEGGVFGEQAQRSKVRDYGQTALIARVSAARPVAHRAYERFTEEGPLALLPQDAPDGFQYALVWCMSPRRAAQVAALDDDAFLAALGEAFGTRLGEFTGASKRIAFPLGLNAGAADGVRIAAIGNAAQTMHPVAGQGLNLGLRDAAVLARLLARDAGPESLARFAAERRADRDVVIAATDAMARVFAGRGPAQALLGLSLGVLDAVAPARMLLAELMMFGRR
ncbi:MAG TPA: UbiH/UbiF/VisC/COQ6 family ubiquinone biosynthesis hydroxylase [Telluria sp.]|nr:UbiH/UbiF/VisC/COQ6 family ubiquinone biosynthesis hydroxylase [Telluria sp.]